jgi:hypothetical protein
MAMQHIIRYLGGLCSTHHYHDWHFEGHDMDTVAEVDTNQVRMTHDLGTN